MTTDAVNWSNDTIIEGMDVAVVHWNLKLLSLVFQIIPLFKKRMLLPLKC